MRSSPATLRRRGSVLILVLWMVIVLGVIGLTYTASVQTQLMTSRMMRGRHQAQWAARAGVERAMAELVQADLKAITDIDPLLDGAEGLKDQPVGERSTFTLLGQPDEELNPRYGLVDECSRININRASEAILLNLEGMSTEMAQSLLDWRDQDGEALEEGAESDYYEALPTPYLARNAAFESVRELMRVKGWGPVFDLAWPDPYLRFVTGAAPAEDLAEGAENLSGSSTGLPGTPAGAMPTPSATDAAAMSEAVAEETPPAILTTASGEELDPLAARTIIDSLTAWSASPRTNPEGEEQVNITEASVNELMQGVPGLSQNEAEAIFAWQKNKRFRNPADLVNVTEPTGQERQQAGLSSGGGQNAQRSQSGQSGQKAFTLQRVGQIIDYVTTRGSRRSASGQAAQMSGRVNINTASREVLLCLPGMSEELADQIVAQRAGDGAIPQPGDVTQLGELSAENFRSLYPWICTSSSRFHVTSQGRDLDSGATVTVEAVLAVDDQQQVSVVYWREF